MAYVKQETPGEVDAAELSKRWRVSVGTVNGWVRAKRLPPPIMKPGRRRWRIEDVERWEQRGGLDIGNAVADAAARQALAAIKDETRPMEDRMTTVAAMLEWMLGVPDGESRDMMPPADRQN